MSKLGIGFWIFILFLILVALRNTDGDWFTPDRRSEVATPNPEELRFDLGRHEQILIVTADTWGSNLATAALWEKNSDGEWKNVTGDNQARIGLKGFKVGDARSEGDGTTPAGMYRLTSTFGSAEEGGTNLPYTQVKRGHCWISDTKDPGYNTWTTRSPCGVGNVDLYERAVKEKIYAKTIVVDFNTAPIVNGRGSAIFVYRHEYVNGERGQARATKAGITLSNNDLSDVFRRLNEDFQPVIILGPVDWITGPKDSTGVDGEKIDLPAPTP